MQEEKPCPLRRAWVRWGFSQIWDSSAANVNSISELIKSEVSKLIHTHLVSLGLVSIVDFEQVQVGSEDLESLGELFSISEFQVILGHVFEEFLLVKPGLSG